MKYSKVILLLLTSISLLLLTNCSKNDELDPNELAEGTFTAKIDGVKFNSISTAASINSIDSLELDLFSVGGVNSNSVLTIGFSIDYEDAIEETTYLFDGTDCSVIDICPLIMVRGITGAEKVFTSGNVGGSMEISFSEIDYRVGGFCRGTFSGIAVNDVDNQKVIKITEGTFNLKIE